MALKLKGSTSGFVAIDAPSVAGNNTLILPENTGSAHQILANDITAGVTTFTSVTVNRNGDLTVPGTISIGGTLTYEDVTSVDSVGIVTARSGVRINGGGLTIIGNTTGLSATGFSTFSGGINVGAALTVNAFASTSLIYLSLRDGYKPDAAGGMGFMSKDHSGSNADGIGMYGHDGLSFHTSQTERLRIAANGNVGVATVTPAQKFHVYGNSGMTAIALGDNSTVQPYMLLEARETQNTCTLHSRTSNPLTFEINTTERMHITPAGIIGVSTDSPTLNGGQQGIHIVSAEYPTLHLTNSTTGHTASDGSMFTLNNTGETIIRNGENSHIRFDTNGSNERMRIDANGMIGIGGVTPKTQNTFDAIEIGKTGFFGSQTAARTIEVVSNAYYNSGWKYKEADVASQYYQYNGYHAFTSATSGSADGAITFSEKFRITADGKVGINDSTPSVTLETVGHNQVTFGSMPETIITYGTTSAYDSGSAGSGIQFGGYFNSTPEYTIFGGVHGVKENTSNANYAGNLVFSTRAHGGNSVERLRLKADGRLWVYGDSNMPTASSGAWLQVGSHTFDGSNYVHDTTRVGMQNNGNLTCISNCSTYNDPTYPGYGFVLVQGATTSSYNTMAICPDGPARGTNMNFHIGAQQTNIHSGANTRQMWINSSGNAYKRDNSANWSTTSDERLKKNIVDNNKGLASINQLRVTSFEYRKEDEIDMSLFPEADNPRQIIIEGEEGVHTGVIAQEIEKVLPECVETNNRGAKTVNPDNLTWYLVNAVKELSAENTALKARLDAAGL